MKIRFAAAAVPVLALRLLGTDNQARAQVDEVWQPMATAPEDVYPLAVIDRPGILPAGGTLLTLAVARAGGHDQGSVGLVLGVARGWELTGAFTDDRISTSEAEVGFGRLLHLSGPTEIDLRFVLPIHLEGTRLRDFSLGPACSYTAGAHWVFSGFSDLLHITFSERLAIGIPFALAVGYQPLRRLHIYGAAVLGELGLVDSTTAWVAEQAPLDVGLIVALARDWDIGLSASTTDIVGRDAEWTATLFASLKSVGSR